MMLWLIIHSENFCHFANDDPQNVLKTYSFKYSILLYNKNILLKFIPGSNSDLNLNSDIIYVLNVIYVWLFEKQTAKQNKVLTWNIG